MDMDNFRDCKWLKSISFILLILYLFSMYMYFLLKENSELFTGLVLIFFIANIIWIFVYYSLYLQDNNENIKFLRVAIGMRLVTFISINIFRLLPNFGVLNSITTYLFILYIFGMILLMCYFDNKL